MTSQFTKFLSKIVIHKMAPNFLQTHFFNANYILPEPKFSLLSNHPVSFLMLWAFAHSCSISLSTSYTCLSTPHQPERFSALKNSAQKSFPRKTLTTFLKKTVTIFSNLFIPQLQLNCIIIPSTLLFFTEYT